MFYPEAYLQRLDVQMRFSQKLLEPAVLGSQRLETRASAASIALLGPPLVERGRAEAVLAAQVCHRHARLDLLDESDDLLGGKSTLAHVRLLWVNGLYLLSTRTAGGGGQVTRRLLRRRPQPSPDSVARQIRPPHDLPHLHCIMEMHPPDLADHEHGDHLLLATAPKMHQFRSNTQVNPGRQIAQKRVSVRSAAKTA